MRYVLDDQEWLESLCVSNNGNIINPCDKNKETLLAMKRQAKEQRKAVRKQIEAATTQNNQSALNKSIFDTDCDTDTNDDLRAPHPDIT